MHRCLIKSPRMDIFSSSSAVLQEDAGISIALFKCRLGLNMMVCCLWVLWGVLQYSILLASCNEKGNRKVYRQQQKHFLTDAELKYIVIGKSKTVDYWGNNYIFFVTNFSVDSIVSKLMLENGGQWEEPLNLLYGSLVDAKRIELGRSFVPNVIDVGVNFGAFTLFAASLNSRVWGFEMQSFCLYCVNMGLNANDYKSIVHLYNYAVWDKSGLTVTFDPVHQVFAELSRTFKLLASLAKTFL